VHVQTGTVASTLVASTVHHILATASIRVGNSGGPILKGNGRVIGIARYDATSAIAPNGSVAAQHLAVLSDPTQYVIQPL
jgi:S1-C subfamily serine protease